MTWSPLAPQAADGAPPPAAGLLLTDWMQRYEPLVYSQCRRLLRSPVAAADATQDTFLAAYCAWSRFRGGSVEAWLRRIARNKCYDQLRRARGHPLESLQQLSENPAHPFEVPSHDGRTDPEGSLLRIELRESIRQALAALRSDERRLILLADLQGRPYAEIAALTHSGIGTVKSRIHRTRRKLRAVLVAQHVMG